MEYYYLNNIKGSNKGLISEILFKNSRKNIFCTKLCQPEIIERLSFEIPKEIKEFLNVFWSSLDCFEFKATRKQNNRLEYQRLVLYEVKSKKFNPEEKYLFQRFKFTESEVKVYKKAIQKGILVKIAKVFFYENWKYSIHLEDFNPKREYHICNGSEWYRKKNL